MAIDPENPQMNYEKAQLIQELTDRSKAINSWAKDNGLSYDDVYNSASAADRYETNKRYVELRSKDTYEQAVSDIISSQQNKLLPKDDANAWAALQVEQWASKLNPAQYAEDWNARTQEILDGRTTNPELYNNIMTYPEIQQELGKQFRKATIQQELQSKNSAFLSWVGMIGGAAVGYFESPVNAVTSVAPGLGWTWKGLTLFQAIHNGTKLLALDQMVNTAQTLRDLPTFQNIHKEAFGEYPTGEQQLQEYAIGSALVAGGSALGAGLGYALGRGQTRSAFADVPNSNIKEGAINASFAERVQSVSGADQAAADVGQEFVDIAKTSPPDIRQSEHFTNTEVVGNQLVYGQDVEPVFKSNAEEFADYYDFDSPAFKSTYDELHQIYDSQQTKVAPAETLSGPEELAHKSRVSEFEDLLNSMPDDYIMNIEDGIEKMSTKEEMLNKFKGLTDDIDAIGKVITCYRQGGPKKVGA